MPPKAMMDTISRQQAASITPARSDGKKRRYYRREQKLRIVEETYAPGASVSVIARKYDVNANIVFAWRREHKRGRLGPTSRRTEPQLLPILLGTEAQRTEADPALPASPGHIEIHLDGGRWIYLAGAVDPATLRAVLAELTRT